MPLYQYVCSSCKHTYEKIQKFGDPEDKICSECGKPVHRPLSQAGLAFKGSGWYITDYKRGNSNDTE